MTSIDELRVAGLLRELPGERLEDLLRHGSELRLGAGDYLFREGEEARHFHLLLEGELETTHTVAGDEVFLARHEPGGFLSATALLTDTPYRGSTRAVAVSRVLAVEPEAFRRLVVEEPGVLRAVIRAIPAVLQNLKAIERDREKLIALGGLAAGLAHELNNPAAAAGRAARELGEADAALERTLRKLSPELASVLALAAETRPQELDPLEASDRAEALAARLEERGVDGAHELAAALVEAGLEEGRLGELEPEALALLGARLRARGLLHELSESTRRISELVAAVKQYSYMDQAPRQEIDVHDGLASTLIILGHKLREGSIEVVEEYDRSLPRLEAYGSELNQVWTNLIDNAIGALEGTGHVWIRTRRDGDCLVVEVADDGRGIPDEIRGRIFDPFFTTKPPGRGTGIGLDISQAIVVKHHGEIRVDSSPAGTTFQVRLPLGR